MQNGTQAGEEQEVFSSKGRSNLNVGGVARGSVRGGRHRSAQLATFQERFRVLSQLEPLNVSDLLVGLSGEAKAFGNSFSPTAGANSLSGMR